MLPSTLPSELLCTLTNSSSYHRDAWSAQHGLSRTAAKRAYISTLIATMHKYASSTPEARELVAELEFVWDQVKANSEASGSGDSAGLSYTRGEEGRRENEGLRILRPASEEDVEEEDEEDEEDGDAGVNEGFEATIPPHTINRPSFNNPRWRRRIEASLVKITAEIAALREQMEAKRVFSQGAKRRAMGPWMLWLVWVTIRHLLIDAVVVGCVMLWVKRGEEWGIVRRWMEGWRGVWKEVLGRLRRGKGVES